MTVKRNESRKAVTSTHMTFERYVDGLLDNFLQIVRLCSRVKGDLHRED